MIIEELECAVLLLIAEHYTQVVSLAVRSGHVRREAKISIRINKLNKTFRELGINIVHVLLLLPETQEQTENQCGDTGI